MPIIILLTVACQSPSQSYAPVINGWQQGKADYHRVQSGETLYAIAWYYGYDTRELAKMNNLSPPYTLKIGQKITFIQQVPAIKRKVRKVSSKNVVKQKSVAKNDSRVNPSKGMWLWPTKGRVISNFGQQNQANKGIDIAGAHQQPIYASLSGNVVYSGNGLMGYGNLIIIKHSDDYLSAYAYNAKNIVHEGDTVKRGQKIALMGKPNMKTPRLHFEIRRQGKPVNPTLYVKSN